MASRCTQLLESPLRPQESSKRLRVECVHDFDRSEVYQVISLSLPYLDLHSSLGAVSAAGREYRDLVHEFRKRQSAIVLDGSGKSTPLCIRSFEMLYQYLLNEFNPLRVEKIVIRDATVIVSPTEEHDRAEWELSCADEKARVALLPLGIFPHFPNLTEVRIVSASKWQTTQSFLIQAVRSQPTKCVLPVQVGLANLHEIADHCPRIEVIDCFHLETDHRNSITDLWGPDCTLALARKFCKNCTKLREIGVLSSPGPRILNEIRRMGTVIPFRPITETPEINETYRTSFLSELGKFRSPTRVVVSVSSPNTPKASARSAVRHFRDQLEYHLGGEMGPLGELSDVIEVVPEFSESTKLTILSRATANRMVGPHASHSIRENDTFSHFCDQLLKVVGGIQVQALQVPSDSLCQYPVGTSSQLVSMEPKLHRSTSFAVSVSSEPRPKRSMTDLSSQGSQVIERSMSILEPDEATGSLVLFVNFLGDEVEENEDPLFGNGRLY